jgi:hypothetical protein
MLAAELMSKKMQRLVKPGEKEIILSIINK